MLTFEKTIAPAAPLQPQTPAQAPIHPLAAQLLGALCLPGTPAYDEARKAWVSHVDQHPALIVLAHNADDISAAVRYARTHQLSVAVQATGHGGLRVTRDTLLIVTSRMTSAHINADQRTAYVEAGAKWGIVLEKAQAVGLAPLLGSTSDVGAVGYTLGGGMGWLARKHGFAADSVNAFDVVTADGQQLRASATQNTDLFWALRGGGGGFVIVTGMEIRLYPVTQVYAGNLIYPIHMAREVMQRWREMVAIAPDALTTAVVIMNYPPLPVVPEFLRGQSFVMVRGCYADEVSLEGGYLWVQSWRNWKQPLHDFWNVMPFSHGDMISQDPVEPLPSLPSGAWLSELTDDAIDALIAGAGSHNGQPPAILFNEVRLMGGAMRTVNAADSPIGHRDAGFVLNSAGLALSPEMKQAVERASREMKRQLAPVLAGVYQNFVDGEERQSAARHIFSTSALYRLAGIKAKYDPQNILRHSVKLA